MKPRIAKQNGQWSVTRDAFGFTREPLARTAHASWREAIRSVVEPPRIFGATARPELAAERHTIWLETR
jgi:hypothetical protein